MENKYLLIVALLFTSITVFSQPSVRIGVTTGMNSTYVLDKGLSADPRYNTTANFEWAPVGFTFGLDISNKFGLQLESIKAAQGQIYQVIDAYDQVVGERNIDMSVLQFPLLMRMMSGGDATTRFNFQVGPQLSLLQKGVETIEYAQSIQNIPDGADIPAGATPNPDGTYNVPELPATTLLSNAASSEVEKFKNKEIQIAGGFGLDIDMLRNFMLSINVRANYSFTDMRNEDLLERLQSNSLNSILAERANLQVGMQLGLYWSIGGTRAFKAKDKKIREQMKRENGV